MKKFLAIAIILAIGLTVALIDARTISGMSASFGTTTLDSTGVTVQQGDDDIRRLPDAPRGTFLLMGVGR
jgi:hypothetical protein